MMDEEQGKETKMRIFYVTFFLVMVSSLILAYPLFADIEGDIELLRLIADGYEANLEKLRTWKAKVALKGFHTAIPSTDWGERQWESQNEFLLDRDQDAIRWHGETVKGKQTLEGKTSPLPQDVHSGMIKSEYDYRLTFPENGKGRRNLLIIPSGQWPRNFESNVFDPIHILTKEIYPDLVGQLRYYHRLGGKMKSNGRITLEGDIVTVETDNNYKDYGRIITRFVFDLSKGCCLTEFFTSSRISESHWKLDYEKIADVFVMKNVALTYKDKREDSRYVSTREAVLTNEMVNEPVDPTEFEINKLGMRPGDMVQDRVAGGVRYEWKADFTALEMVENVRETVLVEAESFENLGGWVVDQQFMDQMGSPYLLAHGLGEPVTDANTTVTLPKVGLYRAWVRTRDWVGPWEASGTPGKFQLLLDGEPLKTTFGTEGADWHWQDGGTVEITNRQVTLTLHDLTGFEGRCDAIVLTSDMDFLPPNEGSEMAEFRRKTMGLPEKPEDAGRYDLVVVGGGIAGTCTAVSAARLGLQVALIQDRPVLGGNNSSEVRVHLGGKINLPPYPALGDIVKELDSGKTGNAQPAENYSDQKKLAVVQAEKNIRLFLNTHVWQMEKDGSRIVAVLAKEIRTSKKLRFSGSLFADCTGDGTVGYLAGADHRMGRESTDQTGESLAPEKPDKMTLGTSVMWYSVETDEPASFPECPWALQFTEKTCQNATMGNWNWETGLHRDTITEAEHIRDHMFRAIYGNWAFQKNHSADKEKYARRKLAWVAYIAGKRESRRLLGDVILKQQDIQQNKEFPDAFVTTTWSIDLHYPQPKNAEQFDEPFRAVAEQKSIKPYPIPYRCLYSRNIENLFMAGRDISVTHVALGTVRVMRTGGMMGELVGMAASLCKKYGTTPQCIYQRHLAELKELAQRGVRKSRTKYSGSVKMVFPEADWQQATAESQGLGSNRLEAAVSYLRDNSGPDGVNELVIIRNGYMIWKGFNIDKVHGVWSLTKSFTSTVLGLLIDEGKATLETLAKDYVPSMTKTYPTVTLRHFATMTSGYYAVGDEPRGSYKHGPSLTPFLPGQEPLFTPGTKYAYWDSAMNQFASTLTRIAGEPIEELFKRRIAEPIGMNPSKWDWGDFGDVDGMVVNGGSGNQNKHIFISARELARFGHLFLNRGLWNGRRLISQSWVDTATKAHVPASLPLEQLSGADGRGVYGFNWWTNGVKPDGQRKWPDAPAGTYAASGYNNNDMFVIPEWNMVIVRLGLDERQKKITDAIYNTFLQKVSLAITGPDSGNSASI